MFEDSTFESTGRIRTRSRGWMMAAFLFNGSILLALTLIPLIYPEALQRQWTSLLIEAPRLPEVGAERPKPVTKRTVTDLSEIHDGHLVIPTQIPTHIRIVADPGPPTDVAALNLFDLGGERSQLNPALFQSQHQSSVIHQPAGPVRVTSRIAEGMILQKVMPIYPPIAKATRKEGAVVLQATISTSGLIENLRVVSGEQMLVPAALEAVKNWRYRPYLLNGQPVEVETTINVIFKLSQ